MVIGMPQMQGGTVTGSLDFAGVDLNREELLNHLLAHSPQVQTAEIQLKRARAAVGLAKARRIPDLSLGGGIGYNYENVPETNKPVGLEAFFQIGIPLPLFNRNQGNIAVAHAEHERAEKEVQRVKLNLSARFADLYAQYLNSKTVAQKYRDDLLPRAKQAYQLYLKSFQQMAAAYPQVLIAQRTWHQLETEYFNAATQLWTSTLQLQGFMLSEGALEAPSFKGYEAETDLVTQDTNAPSVR